MSFDSKEFLKLASDLAQGSDEVRLRTAVGRAYYAVFLQARDNLGVRGRHNIHGRVIAALKAKDRAAGDQLDKLETLRGVADYEMTIRDQTHSNWPFNWKSAYNYAIHVLRRLKSFWP